MRGIAVDGSKRFSDQDRFTAQIGKDLRSRPYSLTDAFFRLDRDGVRVATDADLKP